MTVFTAAIEAVVVALTSTPELLLLGTNGLGSKKLSSWLLALLLTGHEWSSDKMIVNW